MMVTFYYNKTIVNFFKGFVFVYSFFFFVLFL